MKRVITSVTVCAMLILLAGCGSGQAAKEPTPEDVVASAIDAVKTCDFTTANAAWGSDIEKEADAATEDDQEAVVKAICSGIQYEIVSSDIAENTATVTVKISNKDLGTAFKDAMGEMFAELMSNLGSDNQMTEEESQQYFTDLFVEKINGGDYTTVDSTVDVALTKGENGWEISGDTEDAIDAMFGGLISVANEMSKDFN